MLRPSSDSSDTGKGNELAKSCVRCLSPVALKSLGPPACVGSTPTPGTNTQHYHGREVGARLRATTRTSGALLRSQCDEGIDPGGAACRNPAGADGDETD